MEPLFTNLRKRTDWPIQIGVDKKDTNAIVWQTLANTI
jgi:hypothetical protein